MYNIINYCNLFEYLNDKLYEIIEIMEPDLLHKYMFDDFKLYLYGDIAWVQYSDKPEDTTSIPYCWFGMSKDQLLEEKKKLDEDDIHLLITCKKKINGIWQDP